MRFAPEEQLLLKAASAVGGPVNAELLLSVYPGDLPLSDIHAMLEHLVERELLRALGTRAGTEYEFRHAISEEVTYNLLPFAQRRVLHAAIATALEQDHAGRLEPLYGQLAQTLGARGEKARAIEYLERAAEQALRSYANHDAIQYVRRAFELGDHSRGRERKRTALAMGNAAWRRLQRTGGLQSLVASLRARAVVSPDSGSRARPSSAPRA